MSIGFKRNIGLVLKSFGIGIAALGALAALPNAFAQTGNSGDDSSSGLEEVIVTAQKRQESLQEVPVPVAVVNTSDLADSNLTQLQDYASKIPGLSVTPETITIRGLATSANTNPTVALTMDDVPLGVATAIAGATGNILQLDPNDLQQIEVLRGPQGTLYGAASLGGLIKFVTRDASFDGFAGHVTLGTSSVKHGDGMGTNASASLNVPVSDTFALRASALVHEDPGYIDDPVTGADGFNASRVRGARLTTMWKPSDAVSVKLSGLFQENNQYGNRETDFAPGFDDLQAHFVPGTGYYNGKSQAYTATVKAQLGISELTSVTGYIERNSRFVSDFGTFFSFMDADLGGFTLNQLYFPPEVLDAIPTIGYPSFSTARTTKLTQELRLAVPISERVDLLLGGFYTDESSKNLTEGFLGNADTGEAIASEYLSTYSVPYREYAAFANVTVKFTDRFDVQIGGRQAKIEESYDETASGPVGEILYGETPHAVPHATADGDPFTYLFTPRWRVSDDVMTYLRVASGYRPGAPNPGAAALGFPAQVEPDETRNYELGVKGNAFDGRLAFDASVYHIDWDDLQLLFAVQGTYFADNGGSAESQGVELSVQVRPAAGLTVGGWVAYSDATLSEAFPPEMPSFGQKGDQLPFSSRLSGNLSVEQAITMGSSEFNLGGTISYVGKRLGNFPAASLVPGEELPRQEFGAYAQVDLNAGMRRGPWSINLFATNVTDKRGLVYGGVGSGGVETRFTVIRPRTIGLNATMNF